MTPATTRIFFASILLTWLALMAGYYEVREEERKTTTLTFYESYEIEVND